MSYTSFVLSAMIATLPRVAIIVYTTYTQFSIAVVAGRIKLMNCDSCVRRNDMMVEIFG